MALLGITVEEDVLDANGGLLGGEAYSHGMYENAAGNTDEFVPGVTDECPECYGALEEFFVGSSEPGEHERVERHRPLLAVCADCRYVPFKDELVRLYPPQE